MLDATHVKRGKGLVTGSTWLPGRGVAALLATILLVVQSFVPVAAQGAEIRLDDVKANGIVSGEVKDQYAPGRAIVTVHNLRRFWVAIEPADQWGSMTFEPAPTTGDRGDLGGAWATIAVIPPLGTAAYDLSWDPRAGGSQAFRVHYDGTSAGGLAAVALNVVQLVGHVVGEGELKGGSGAVATALQTITQLPGWADIVRKNQGDAMALTDLPAVVKALLGSSTGRKALREALKAVGIDIGLPALRKIATGVSGAEVLLFLEDLGDAVSKGQVDGSVAFYVFQPTEVESPTNGAGVTTGDKASEPIACTSTPPAESAALLAGLTDATAMLEYLESHVLYRGDLNHGIAIEKGFVVPDGYAPDEKWRRLLQQVRREESDFIGGVSANLPGGNGAVILTRIAGVCQGDLLAAAADIGSHWTFDPDSGITVEFESMVTPSTDALIGDFGQGAIAMAAVGDVLFETLGTSEAESLAMLESIAPITLDEGATPAVGARHCTGYRTGIDRKEQLDRLVPDQLLGEQVEDADSPYDRFAEVAASGDYWVGDSKVSLRLSVWPGLCGSELVESSWTSWGEEFVLPHPWAPWTRGGWQGWYVPTEDYGTPATTFAAVHGDLLLWISGDEAAYVDEMLDQLALTVTELDG